MATVQGNPSPGIELVNQNGRVYPITAVSQNWSQAQYSFLIDQNLPAGAITRSSSPTPPTGA